jgi:hypothetical protein
MINWKNIEKLNVKDPSTVKMIMAAINKELGLASEGLAKVAEFNLNNSSVASAAFPAVIDNLLEKYHTGLKDADTLYTSAFQTINLTTGNTYRVDGISSGLTFSLTKDGEKALIHSVKGDYKNYDISTYSAGMELSQQWLDDNEFWLISDATDEFISKYYQKRAEVFYALIEALTDSNVYNTQYATTSGASQSSLDVETINNSAYKLITALKTAGMSVNPQTQLIMYCPLKFRDRILRAFAANNTGFAVYGGSPGVNFNITPVFTTYISAAKTYAKDSGNAGSQIPLGYLCVPGKKNKIAERMPLSIMDEQDIRSLSQTIVGWSRFGGNINEAQWQRVESAV